MAISAIYLAMQQGARQKKSCEVVGITCKTFQNWLRYGVVDKRRIVEKNPANKLTQTEEKEVLEICNSKEFMNKSPKQIVPELADQGVYLASESSFYRILRKSGQLEHRGRSAKPRNVARPKEHKATGPNQVWSWDITYLASTVRGKFFYLYLFMDIYSRKIVGWEVYERESAENAATVLQKTRLREGVPHSRKLVLHSDNGSPMKGATMLATMQKIGVMPSFSRPSVSNDNPFSESLFKTMKYGPHFPQKPFSSVEDARGWVASFALWYNFSHRHSGLKFVTPVQRHTGQDKEILKKRSAVYELAKSKNPERWSQDIRDWSHDEVMVLNPSKEVADIVALKKAA